ncbi:hypothetical protein C8R46DRAFT_1030709 [Mycena filopes]|nr:hypothetical protein C8R46DRAFT_1030709 [Mycena filopes]
MTQLISSDQGASPAAAPCNDSSTVAGEPVDAQYPVPSGAAHAYSMLSIAANALATAAGAPPPPSAAPTSASQGIQYTGPWIAGALYGVVPAGPLTMIPDNGEHWLRNFLHLVPDVRPNMPAVCGPWWELDHQFSSLMTGETFRSAPLSVGLLETWEELLAAEHTGIPMGYGVVRGRVQGASVASVQK